MGSGGITLGLQEETTDAETHRRYERPLHHLRLRPRRTGRGARDLETEGVPFVVVDPKEDLQERMLEDGVSYVIDDPSLEAVLEAAWVKRVRAFICAVDSDATNVHITLMARSLNPDIFIVARASEPGSDWRLEKAGADRVVSPFVSSGRHMALIALQPAIVDVLEVTAQRRTRPMRVEELLVDEGSPLEDKTVAEARGSATALAVRHADGALVTDPPEDLRLRAGDLLLVMGNGT